MLHPVTKRSLTLGTITCLSLVIVVLVRHQGPAIFGTMYITSLVLSVCFIGLVCYENYKWFWKRK